MGMEVFLRAYGGVISESRTLVATRLEKVLSLHTCSEKGEKTQIPSDYSDLACAVLPATLVTCLEILK